MTYVMADVHGQYEKYRKMLDKIGMTAWDELYILGDVVDRGPEPMAILMDMDFNIDIIPILGNGLSVLVVFIAENKLVKTVCT